MKPYPILFHPILKTRVWGGRLLESLGKKLPPNEPIGESWEIADLPPSIEHGRSVIANGELTGMTLHEAISTHRSQIMGDANLAYDSGFSLLIKFLDAQENLSVQVHPNAEYAAANPGSHLKSEAWVIINAVPDSFIYKGIKPNVSAQDFVEHIRTGEVVDDLIAVPARIGECHYLPSGICHALGAGVMVAEVQTPSDTTFRVYDWGRHGRELHINQAMQCIQFGERQTEVNRAVAEPIVANGLRTTIQCQTEFFTINKVEAIQQATFPVVTNNLPEVWMMIGGTGQMNAPGMSPVQLAPGTTTLVPADLTDATMTLHARAWLLRVQLPSPFAGKIA